VHIGLAMQEGLLPGTPLSTAPASGSAAPPVVVTPAPATPPSAPK